MFHSNPLQKILKLFPRASFDTIVDKSYCDYSLWHKIHAEGAFFVTRFKQHAALDTLKSLPVEDDTILTDQIVTFRYNSNRAGHHNAYYGTALRKITVYREGTKLYASNKQQPRSS